MRQAPWKRCRNSSIRIETRGVKPQCITIWIGIPSVSVLENSKADHELDAYLDDLFVQMGAGDHLILSIAGTAPPGIKFSRLERIARMARSFGPVKP